MSLDNAKQFIAKIYDRKSEAMALLPNGAVPERIGTEEVAVIAKAATAAGWDFTADELQEAYLDSLALDEDELFGVAGGIIYSEYRAVGPGGCSSNYYVEQCGATWETGSSCTCTDYQPFTNSDTV